MNVTEKTVIARAGEGRARCVVEFASYNKWIRQIVSGFYDLSHAGAIDLEVRTGKAPLGMSQLVAATIDGRTRVIYDAHDGYNFLIGSEDPHARFDALLDECDLWFKYTCLDSEHVALRNRDKIRPMGLISIFFGSHHNPYDVGLAPFDAKALFKTVVGMSDLASRAIDKNSRHMWPEYYEVAPGDGDGRVLYVTRAFDPDAPEVENDEVRQERVELNAFRAGVVREGRRVLGDAFVGGLQRNAYAHKHYPDCICDGPVAVNRWQYLRALRCVSVGLAGAGLHGTSGSKLGEYIAASRGVVTTPLPMRLPGEFAAGANYLEASTPEDAVCACVRLLDDPSLLSAMMQANHRYYQEYVRPAAAVARTIETALETEAG